MKAGEKGRVGAILDLGASAQTLGAEKRKEKEAKETRETDE